MQPGAQQRTQSCRSRTTRSTHAMLSPTNMHPDVIIFATCTLTTLRQLLLLMIPPTTLAGNQPRTAWLGFVSKCGGGTVSPVDPLDGPVSLLLDTWHCGDGVEQPVLLRWVLNVALQQQAVHLCITKQGGRCVRNHSRPPKQGNLEREHSLSKRWCLPL